MCTLKKMSEMTGLCEDKLLKKKPEDSTAILKALCMQCKRIKRQQSYAQIAKEFGLMSHSTVISNIQMIECNPNHPKIIAAKQTHRCYRQEVCIIPATKSEAKSIFRENLEDLLAKTSVFDKRFEEILRDIRNRDIRNSPQRFTAVYH